MPSSRHILLALGASSATALQLPGVGEVSLNLPQQPASQINYLSVMKLITRRARRSAPALPSTKDLKIAAIDFVSEARQNPLSALPAVGAAGAAGLVLFAAASTLTAPPVAEGGVYKGVGVGTDGIVRIGFPAGGEVLVPGAPFQAKNGYLGMWNWEKQGKPVPKDQTPEAQKALREAFDAERKKFDVEAQQQGYKDAEDRGIQEKERILAEKAAAKAAKEAAKAAAAAEKERLAAEAKKPGTVSQPKYYGNIRGIAQPATYGVGAPKK